MERNYRFEILTEHDLDLNIDLINKHIYAVEPGAYSDSADETLLEEEHLKTQKDLVIMLNQFQGYNVQNIFLQNKLSFNHRL